MMTEAEFNSRWPSIAGPDLGIPACPEGMAFLKAFADRYPRSFEFLHTEDFINLDLTYSLVLRSGKPLPNTLLCVLGATKPNVV